MTETLNDRTTNQIRWSPRGRHVILATVGSTSKYELDFWDLDFYADDFARKDPSKEEWGTGIQHLGTAEHYGVTDLEWDPSGRYLATSGSRWADHKVSILLILISCKRRRASDPLLFLRVSVSFFHSLSAVTRFGTSEDRKCTSLL